MVSGMLTSGLLLSSKSENTQVGSQATYRLLTIYYYLVWYYCVGFIAHEFAILLVKYLRTRFIVTNVAFGKESLLVGASAASERQAASSGQPS